MFTIKHIVDNDRSVYSCDWYRIVRKPSTGATGNGPPDITDTTKILLYNREKNEENNPVAPFEQINVLDGNSAYIENASGKTVDMIRYAGHT